MNRQKLLCCTPRIRAEYDKQYTFGVDRNVHNFHGCGKKYFQELPQMGKGPAIDVVCRKNYYDEICNDCHSPIDNDLPHKPQLPVENFRIYRN